MKAVGLRLLQQHLSVEHLLARLAWPAREHHASLRYLQLLAMYIWCTRADAFADSDVARFVPSWYTCAQPWGVTIHHCIIVGTQSPMLTMVSGQRSESGNWRACRSCGTSWLSAEKVPLCCCLRASTSMRARTSATSKVVAPKTGTTAYPGANERGHALLASIAKSL